MKADRQSALARALFAVCLVATVGFILACASAPAPTPMPVSRWAGTYAYRYDPPQRAAPASTRINVVVVEPFYREVDSSIAERLYSRVARGFSRSMGVDLDKIIVAKGMTAIGPYNNLADVTYPDKKGSDLTLAPRVFITAEAKLGPSRNVSYDGIGYMEKDFVMNISGWVSYEMQEPLSGQKMWIKRLDLEDRTVRGVEIYEAVAVRRDQYGNVVQWREGDVKYSGREDAMADAIRDYYPQIMQRAWTYLNTDEMIDLKEKSKEIRVRIQAPLR